MAMQGKTFGLTFWENYYIVGQGPDFQFVRYIGHTLQGGYNGLLTCTPACAKHACERRQKRVPMPVSAVPAGRLQAAFCSLLPRLQALSLPFDLYHALSLHTLPPAPAPLWCACANEAGAFVLSKTPELSPAALQEVKKIAKEQGLDLGGFCRINNKACGVSNTKSPANDLQDVIGVCLLRASVQVPIACRLCGTDFCPCYTRRFSARGSLSVLLSDTQATPTATSSTCLTDRRSSRPEVLSDLVGPARTSLPSASPVGGSICLGSSKSTPERASASTCLLPHAWPGADVHEQVENGLVESNHTQHSSADRGGCVFSWIARRGLDSKSSLRSLQFSVVVSDGERSKRVPGHAA